MEVGFLRKQIDTSITELSVERLRSTGFTNSVRVHAHAVLNDFSRVYEELEATIHPLDLKGKGLFDRWMAQL